VTATLRLSTGDSLTYCCDVSAHRVVVRDGVGRFRFAFGAYGARPGQFDTPLALTFVMPEFHGEQLPGQVDDAIWVAVADYGNRRVQVFELDGCLVGTIRDEARATRGGPCQLTWRPPVLDVESEDGRRSGVHLAAALMCGSAQAFDRRRVAEERLVRASGVRH